MSEHIPMRTCVGCRQVRKKRELIRIVRLPDGSAHADPAGTAPGRGAYLCNDPACLETARKRRALSRSFSCAMSGEAYDALQRELFAPERIPDPGEDGSAHAAAAEGDRS